MPLWTPSELTNQFWLDVSDSSTLYDATTGGSLVTSGNAVARAEDKSGNAKHVRQTTSGSRPLRITAAQNGLDVLRFDGTDDWMIADTASDWTFLHSSTNATVYMVCRIANTASPDSASIPLSTRSSGVNRGWYLVWDDRTAASRSQVIGAVTYYGGATSVVNLSSSGTLPGNTWTLISAENENTATLAADRSRVRLGDNPAIANNTGTPTIDGVAPAYALRLGGSSLFTAIDIGEVIVRQGVDSTDNRQLTAGYLAHKWGLEASLPIGHPYKSAAPTTGNPTANLQNNLQSMRLGL